VAAGCHGKSRWEDVFTVSGAHRFMIDHGVIPQVHIDCDPRPHKALQIGQPHENVEYWLASCISPFYLDRLEGHEVKLWHSYNGTASRIAFQIDPDQKNGGWGGSIGLRAMSILYARGYREFEITAWIAPLRTGKPMLAPTKVRRRNSYPCNATTDGSRTSAVFVLYARFFHKQLSMMPDAIINLHGDGLLQHMNRSEHE
jgi:hypothetical protein